jgi:rsbT co-antagonist protein RsbR
MTDAHDTHTADQKELAALRQYVTELQQQIASYHKVEEERARLHTRLQQQTEALRQSQDMLRGVLNNTSALIFVRDTQGSYMMLNESYCKLVLNLRQEQVIGKTPDDVFSQQTARQLLAHDQQVIDSGKPIVREELIPHFDEEEPRIYLAAKFPLFDEQGKIYAVGGISTDITDRKRAEEALSRERQLFVGGPVIVFKWAAREGWPVEYVSPNIAQFGYQAEDFTSGRIPYPTVVHPDDLMRVAGEVQSYSAAGRETFEQSYRVINAQGEPRWIYDFTVVVRNSQGDITHYDGYVMDITEQKQSEEERAALQAQLIEAQREAIRELSTPLMPLNDNVVAMPIVGTIDTGRAQQIMETLLEGIARQQAAIAILDITGVQVVDTQVADALIRAAQAARLLGAQVVLTGIGPTIAQTLVHLGADLTDVVTRSTLQAGIAYAMEHAAGTQRGHIPRT